MKNLQLVWMIWLLSFRFLSAYCDKLLNFILLPIVVLSLLGVATVYEPRLIFINIFLHLILYVMFSVAWHNYILSPRDDRTLWQYLKWDRQKLQFLGFFLLMLFVMAMNLNIAWRPILWLLHGMDFLSNLFKQGSFIEGVPPLEWGFIDLLALFGFVFLCFPMSRFMYVFPLSALGKDSIFRRSFNLSGRAMGFSFLLFLSLLLFQVSYGVAGMIFRYFLIFLFGEDSWTLLLLSEIFLQGYNYFTLAFLITPLSFGYDILNK